MPKRILFLALASLLLSATVSGTTKQSQAEKRKQVAALFEKAVEAFANKSYQQAIQTAEQIRRIPIAGDTRYLNEAKQIIDRARMMQKEEFDPFLLQANEKFKDGDFKGSFDLCSEIAQRDPAYTEAKECMARASRKLRLRWPRPLATPP